MAKNLSSTKPLSGNLRSHSNRAVKHSRKPNLQNVTLENGKKVRLSAREIRTLKKEA